MLAPRATRLIKDLALAIWFEVGRDIQEVDGTLYVPTFLLNSLYRLFFYLLNKVEPFSNTKFQKLNSFFAVPVTFFKFWNMQIRQFWDCCRFWPSINSIMKSWCDDVGEGA